MLKIPNDWNFTHTPIDTMCQYLLDVKSGWTNIVICQLDDLWWTWKQSWVWKTVLSIHVKFKRRWPIAGGSGRTRALCGRVLIHLPSVSLLALTTLLWHLTLFVCFPPQFLIPGTHVKGEWKQHVPKFWQFWKFLFPYFLFHYYS